VRPAYDLRNLELEICDFQEQGLRIENDYSFPTKIHSDLAVRRDSMGLPRRWCAEYSDR
jgi:hypothetical protein